jgi:hypothetical protein
MAIVIPSKVEKQKTMLIDAVRIQAWQEFKSTNKETLQGLKFGGYEVFDVEWKEEEIHNFTYDKVLGFITQTLGYRVNELLNLRAEYYAMKAGKSAYNRDKGSQQVPDTAEMSVF